MKRYVKSSTNELMKWFRSDAVDELMKGMSRSEKRIIGRLANAADIDNYFYGMVETLEMLEVHVSDAFETFIQEFAERM